MKKYLLPTGYLVLLTICIILLFYCNANKCEDLWLTMLKTVSILCIAGVLIEVFVKNKGGTE